MDIIRNCCNLRSTTVRLGRSLDDIGSAKFAAAAAAASSSSCADSGKLRWKLLWRKFRKEKRKVLHSWGSVKVVTYDPYSYSQNFDQGSLWDDEPDNLSRSFSARYAVPSRIFLKQEVM